MKCSNACRVTWGTLVLVTALGTLATPALAQQRPVQLSLVTPVQIFPDNYAISGFRLNLIYGRNAAMTGLDIGLANHVTGPTVGAQFGVVNLTESFVGWQDGLINLNDGEFEGLQWGGFNQSGRLNGLQLGIVNYAQTANGLQIGLINIIKTGGAFPVMVIANWSFK
jgi:hypothetical protein